ncbi:MAG: pentapeptide repeat-containing protein [Cyanobacteria bacterium P01_C01_bin.121]
MSKSPLTILENGIDCWNRWRAATENAPCSLSGQDLSGGYFFEGNFRNVDLSGASLKRSCFIGADFTGANLQNADLSNAYVDKANFDKAILVGIDLTGTNTSTANFRQAIAENKLSSDSSLQHRLLARTNPVNADAVMTHSNNVATLLPPAHVPDRMAAAVGSFSETTAQTDTQTALSIGSNQHSYLVKHNKRSQRPIVRAAVILMGLVIAIPSVMIAATSIQKLARQTSDPSKSITASQLDPLMKQRSPQPSRDLAAAPAVNTTTLSANLTLVKSIEVADQVWAIDTQTRDDGQVVVASGDAEGTVQIWDGPTGEALRTLKAHNDMVRSVAISPSGERLVSSSGDGIKVWQPQTGELLYSLPTEPGVPVWSVAISPDEQTFVSGDYAGNIRVWEMESGAQRYHVSIGEPVWSVAIAPDSQSFVSGSDDNLAHHWDLATGALLQSFSDHTDTVRAVAISPDGKTLATGSWDSTINLWNLVSGELTATLQGHSDRVVSLAISPDGKTLASSSVDSTLRLWDLDKQQLAKTLDNSDGWVLSVAFDPLEQTLVSGGKNKQIKLWQ